MCRTDHVTSLSPLTGGPGIVHEKLLDDYLHRIFSAPDRATTAAASRYAKSRALPLRGPRQVWRLERTVVEKGPGLWVGW